MSLALNRKSQTDPNSTSSDEIIHNLFESIDVEVDSIIKLTTLIGYIYYETVPGEEVVSFVNDTLPISGTSMTFNESDGVIFIFFVLIFCFLYSNAFFSFSDNELSRSYGGGVSLYRRTNTTFVWFWHSYFNSAIQNDDSKFCENVLLDNQQFLRNFLLTLSF
jgi:hypothetical protein